MNKEYCEAISEYNLRELKRSFDQCNNDALAKMFGINIAQARLLKHIISQTTNKEE